MDRIASFDIDHTKLKPGLYVARKDLFVVPGGKISLPVTTFDLRMVAPNSETQKPLPVAALHTIEHIGAAFLRNALWWKDRVVYFGPMGCRTGCNLVLAGDLTPCMVAHPKLRFATVRDLVIGMCWHIMSYVNVIPGATPEECGNYRDHNLLAARMAANDYYNVLCQTSEELGYDQFTYPR